MWYQNIITKSHVFSCFTPEPLGSNYKPFWIQFQDVLDLLPIDNRFKSILSASTPLQKENKIDVYKDTYVLKQQKLVKIKFNLII